MGLVPLGHRSPLVRARTSVRRLRHLRDAAAGSDPGLTRLLTAANAAGAMATALGVELVVARLRGLGEQSTIVGMILGAVVAMMGSMALNGTDAWEKVRTAAFFPVAIGGGVALGVAVSGHPRLMLSLFVVVMFAAVFVRRFGPAYFFYGFMLWMGYFFASFLHATWSMVPDLLLATVVGAAWALLLSLTFTRSRPRRTLDRIRRSFDARARRLAATVTALLRTSVEQTHYRERLRRRLHSQQTQLAEAALMIEAWSAESGALPPGWSGQGLRRRVLEGQLALERMAGAGDRLSEAPPALREAAASVTESFSLDDAAGVRGAVRALGDIQVDDAAYGQAARRLGAVTEEYVRLMSATDAPPVHAPGDFVPSVELAMGNLPSSAAVARDVTARGHRLNPLTRLDFTTRQAVQAAIAGALAIVLGRQLDATRYYWAVIAAFVAFAGTGTRFETTAKALYRVLGTLVGLVVGVGLAEMTQGHIGWMLFTVVASMFCGFYLVRINYAFMIFFVTIMIAQLYMILHQFSDQLLVLRLEETAVGAAAGIAVGLLLAPLSTRDTVKVAQLDLYSALATFLDAVAGRPPIDVDGPTDVDGLMREVDNQHRDLLLVSVPLTRPLLVANSPTLVRRQIALTSRAVRLARPLAAAVRGAEQVDPAVVRSCHALADALRVMIEHPSVLGSSAARSEPEVVAALDAVDAALYGSADDPAHTSEVRTRVAWRALAGMHSALRELGAPQQAVGDDSARSQQ